MNVTLKRDGISIVIEFVDKVKALPHVRYVITKDGVKERICGIDEQFYLTGHNTSSV